MASDEDILDTSKLRLSGDFEEQVQELMEYIRMTREQVERLDWLFQDLFNTLNSVWNGIRVVGFGSVVTGLGIKTSDVDCYIELPSWLYPPEKSFVIKARNTLMQHNHIFKNAYAIVHAKVPIVQFYHVPSQINCDINFNSPGGVENSKLIRYLLDSDKKALKLAVLIKYWSKIHNLTGTNLMPSYCLTLLVIFFLQQCNNLHSVQYLQQNVEKMYIDNWNSAFSTPDYINSENNKSMYELLGEFFKYYNSFEFESDIICPYLGRPIKREYFAKIETIPSEFALYKTNVGTKNYKPIRLDTVMCVQDPFEHNRNCAVAVYPKLALHIKTLISTAAFIYENETEEDFLPKLLQKQNELPPSKKKHKQRPKLNGVAKNYRREQNIRHFNQNLRQKYFRGKNRRHWR
ncbi:terminal uridylyltransferase Tailor-like [Pararge aegeria]|uniref:Jg3202 protein n=2 Tax=Pararge aegeria TaxID=116150 RepID=A0A8S4RRV1_9NEOP|nr:terminal uridylyltransferase Tailor-like [Pararge aegeria]CAH2239632.1 jg3202 [Pararge aegeria aegeria]